LNEVDAAKVVTGQPVEITFDAIDGLNATGTVSVVDQIGTVSSGVVSYGVKIAVNTNDPRIKPGMSVNTTIVTKKTSGVVIVPSAAVKKQGQTSYVLVLDKSVMPVNNSTNASGQNNLGSTTLGRNDFASTSRAYNYNASSTNTAASTTARFANRTGTFTASGSSLTVTTAVVPTQVTVTTGDSDDTNTGITSGLTPGQLVVTKTTTTTAGTAAAPSILNSLGGRRTTTTGTGASGATRVTGGGATVIRAPGL
jgi:multidrug efflux pump subunit AcrA (membrane-fusion protein)